MTKAMYPGTFDPITKGHMDIIDRASRLFDELYIAIMVNPRKQCTFSVDERIELIRKCICGYPNVKVVSCNGLTVRFAKELGCRILVRGIRAIADYEYELAQATSNMVLDDEVETMFMVSRPEFSFLSSSIAKEIAMFEGDITEFIPEAIATEVKQKLYTDHIAK